MALAIYQVDAFTDRPFAGNPAGVCILSQAADVDWMQAVAREMNLPITAFLSRQDDGFSLRWFTPEVEASLCGHGTLASAHILWQTENLGLEEQARFYTKGGLVTATRAGSWNELDFPIKPATEAPAPNGLIEALGATPNFVGKCQDKYILEFDSEDIVRGLTPDFVRLKELLPDGVIVTSRATTAGYDFVSRYFAPAYGINEDFVTGSAHCTLGPYWQAKLGKSEFVAFQASARGGVVRVRVGKDRVYLGGQAVTVLRGELEA